MIFLSFNNLSTDILKSSKREMHSGQPIFEDQLCISVNEIHIHYTKRCCVTLLIPTYTEDTLNIEQFLSNPGGPNQCRTRELLENAFSYKE